MPGFFPPNQVPAEVVLAFRIGFILLIAVSLIGVIIALRRPLKAWRFAFWPIAAGAAFWLSSVYDPMYRSSHFIDSFKLIVVALTGVGFVIDLVRWLRPVYAMGVLFGLFLVVALSLPAGTVSRSRRIDCKNRIRQIAIAMHNWHDQFGRLPDLAISNGTNPGDTLRIILP